ncbi:TRZ/ATZ family protein [Candidatus Fermentibacteria bacterium]|nr:TRZ/ATZ family protein [Candidatus Fermentibacteria bacterium]
MTAVSCSPGRTKGLDGLRAGSGVLVSGLLVALRDAAQARLAELLLEGSSPPFDLDGMIVYYAAPTAGRSGLAVGSAGPTTSSRMDCWLGMLLSLGASATMGKGPRSRSSVRLCVEHRAPYLAAIGGAGAYYASRVRSSRVLAWPDLGPEAVHAMEVDSFPAFVGIDAAGETMFSAGGMA